MPVTTVAPPASSDFLMQHSALATVGASAVASGRYHTLSLGRASRAYYSIGLNDHVQLGRQAWLKREQV